MNTPTATVQCYLGLLLCVALPGCAPIPQPASAVDAASHTGVAHTSPAAVTVAASSPSRQSAVATGALTSYISPLFKPPLFVHAVPGGATCNPPVLANFAPNWPRQLRWVARAWDSRAMRGYLRQNKSGVWEDFGRESWANDPLAPGDLTGLPSCTGEPRTQNLQNYTTMCTWKPSFLWVYPKTPYPPVDLLEPLADPARVSDIVSIHDVLDYVLFKPGAGCAVVHTTGYPGMLSFPTRSAPLPAFQSLSLLQPSTGAVDPGGRLEVLVEGGTRIMDVGSMGGDPPQSLALKGKDGNVVPIEDRPLRIGYSNVGHLLGSNRTGLLRIHKKTGRVARLMDWGEPALPEFAENGTANCCDLVHIADPLGSGVWLVAPAGRPQIWVLDDVHLQVKTKWTIGKIDGQPALAVRQLRAILSTGWLWAVVQTAPEPNYDARIAVWKYALWDGDTPFQAP